jgi:hypothetical protein
MTLKKLNWKKGRGKLGILEPLLGEWTTEADSPMGRVKCTRKFEKVLGGNYIQLDAHWFFGNQEYLEHTMYGSKDGGIVFWSFTSDGKNATGRLSEGSDVHPEAICFEAQMPAGIARMIYWPDLEEGFRWAVESKNKKGWNRFTEHHYTSKH